MQYSNYQNIKLNNVSFSKEEILNFDYSNSEKKEINHIFKFLKNWFDTSNFIEVETSGSTGKPKQIQIKKQSFVESAINTCNYLKINVKQNALLCIPVKYIGGKMMVIRALVSGYNLISIEPSKNPLKNLKQNINFIAITPYQGYHILEKNALDLEKINNVIIGGGTVNENFIAKINTFKNNIYSTFGMTETVSHIALRKLNGADKSKYFEVLNPYKISLNEENCLVIDCPTLTKDKINTNDIIEIKGNKFKWLGRKDNIINSGGIKIYPEEIEKKIAPILIGLNFYISSISDEILGEKLILKIEKSNDIKINLSLVNSKLEKYKSVKEIIYLESFDYTENGKLIR